MKVSVAITVALVAFCLGAINGSADPIDEQIVLNFHEWQGDEAFLFQVTVSKDITVKSLRELVAEKLNDSAKNIGILYNNLAMINLGKLDSYHVPNGAKISVYRHNN